MALLTLTSDIGDQDYLAGAIKGQLLSVDPGFTIVDVSHQIAPFNYPQAAYVCRNAIRNFPAFSFHLLLVNLFDRKSDQLLMAYHKDQYILCADNGLLTMVLEDKPEMVIGLPLDPSATKNTLYCTSVMAEAIRKLQLGTSLQQIGIPDVQIVEKHHLSPRIEEDLIEGQIIFIDNFENIVINITREQFETQRKQRSFEILFKRNEKIDRISETYADVPEGEKLALFNSAGYLEIAINKGNAAGLFGLQRFSEQSVSQQNRLFYQTVRVKFFSPEPA